MLLFNRYLILRYNWSFRSILFNYRALRIHWGYAFVCFGLWLGACLPHAVAQGSPELGPVPIAPDQAPPPPESSALRTSATSAFSRTGDFGLTDLSNRHQIKAFYQIVYNSSEGTPLEWTGDFNSCNAGTTSQSFKDATLIRVNWFRAMSGISDTIVFADSYSVKNQEAALMMARNQSLSHTPPTSWTCYTSNGYEAAGKSNLAIGYNGWDAVTAYMDDSSVGNLGHRRWVIYPQTKNMGTGDVPTYGTIYVGGANALWVMDNNMYNTRPAVRESSGFVIWPPRGYVPYQVVFRDWSVSQKGANFSGAQVTVTNASGTVCSGCNSVIISSSGAPESTLAWKPDSSVSGHWAKPTQDTTYHVSISNISLNGGLVNLEYDVVIFDPASYGSNEVIPTITGSHTMSASGADLSYTKVNFTVGDYQVRTLTTKAVTDPEGAEPGTTGDIIDGTSSSYSLLDTGVKRSGTQSFRLASPNGSGTEYFTIQRSFIPDANSQLEFYSRLGWATATQVATVQISTDAGASWTDLYQQAGTGNAGESGFNQHALSLSAYAGKTIQIRFAYIASGSYFYQTSAGVGLYVDDISITAPKEIVSESAPISIGTTGNFTYIPVNTGSYDIQVRAVPWVGFTGLEWGPLHSIDVSAATGVTVTPVVGTGGSISPTGSQVINAGSTATFAVIPNTGFHNDTNVGGDCPQGSWSGNNWTTGMVNSDCTLNFNFLPNNSGSFCSLCLPTRGGWRAILQ
ncbi:hypothetical protein TI04_03195 [Achromatium sp. WMS2]|nr:hypothetical protein TI04_03195 [Achromatium sp. WMS2]